jgi:hypothetical protein
MAAITHQWLVRRFRCKTFLNLSDVHYRFSLDTAAKVAWPRRRCNWVPSPCGWLSQPPWVGRDAHRLLRTLRPPSTTSVDLPSLKRPMDGVPKFTVVA